MQHKLPAKADDLQESGFLSTNLDKLVYWYWVAKCQNEIECDNKNVVKLEGMHFNFDVIVLLSNLYTIMKCFHIYIKYESYSVYYNDRYYYGCMTLMHAELW